jgi:hypothetical protein
MKTSTLVKIAKTIESRFRPDTSKSSVNEMWARLDSAAGHCRTKVEAASAIAEEVYGLDGARASALFR